MVDSVSAILPPSVYAACGDGFSQPEVYFETPRVFYLSYPECPNCDQAVWIEGIGNISNPFQPAIGWSSGNLGDVLLCHFDATGTQDYFFNFCQDSMTCLGPLIATEELEQKVEIQVFPNPFSDEIRLDYDPAAVSIIGLQIYDARGRLLKSLDKISVPSLNLIDLPSGILYLNCIFEDGRRSSIKILKVEN